MASSYAPTAPRRPVSATTQRSPAAAAPNRIRTTVPRQGWEPPTSSFSTTATTTQANSNTQVLINAAEPSIPIPNIPAEKPGSMFSLLPKRQQTLQHKTYSVAARSVKETQLASTKPIEVVEATLSIAPSTIASPPKPAEASVVACTIAHSSLNHPQKNTTALPPTASALPKASALPTADASRTNAPCASKGAPSSSWLHQFPTVGHFACPCGLPITTAASKARSLGGFPTFCRYFGPSLQLQLTLPSGGAFGSIASFVASCSRCGVELGYIPLTTTVLATTAGHHGQSDEGVHALRVTNVQLLYLGQKAPPEYLSMEVAALANVDDVSEGPGVDGRRAASGRGLRALLSNTQHSPSKDTKKKDATSSDDSSDEDSESDDDDEDDDALWLSMRKDAKRTL